MFKKGYTPYNKGTHITNSGQFQKGMTPKNKTNLVKRCLICGSDFKYIKSREEIAKYCSKKCLGKSLVGIIPKSAFTKERVSGENNYFYGKKGVLAPNYKGGVSPFYKTLRKIKLKEAGGSHSRGEWDLLKIQYNFTCPCCKKQEPEIKLTKDHIISVNKGGSDNIENIQPLCVSCNSKKNVKFIKYELVSKAEWDKTK